VKNINNRAAKWLPLFLANLKACIVEAFPSCKIKDNTTGKEMGGRQAFTGLYIDDMGYAAVA
jgi:hypothetical protein